MTQRESESKVINKFHDTPLRIPPFERSTEKKFMLFFLKIRYIYVLIVRNFLLIIIYIYRDLTFNLIFLMD
jgi:hypothetical protein